MNEVFEGTPYVSTATFLVPPVTGQPTDPSIITATVWVPGSTEITYTYGVGIAITRTDEGIYAVEIQTTGAVVAPHDPVKGFVIWEGKGNAAIRDVDWFVIKPVPKPS